MKPECDNNLKPTPQRLDISKLPKHTRDKLQAMRDSKQQWIDACLLLTAIGDIDDKQAAREKWIHVLEELEAKKGRQWRIAVNRKAADQYKKEESRKQHSDGTQPVN